MSSAVVERAAGRHPSWVFAATAINGGTTFVLLVLIGRAVGVVPYADFSLFWAAGIITGLGFFLPLEQETARRVSGGESAWAVWRHSSMVAAGVALVTGIGGCILLSVTGARPATCVAFAVMCVGYALQLPARGVLAGRHRLSAYSAIVMCDSLFRMVAAVVLVAVGVRTIPPFAMAIALSALLGGVVGLVLVVGHRHDPAGAGRTSVSVTAAVRLILAAACMQALLNSGTVVAKVAAHADQLALAGRLLVVMTIARLPVFVFQSLQATYLARLVGARRSGDERTTRRILGLLGGALAVLILGLVVGAAVAGPWAVRLVYGPAFVIDRGVVVLIAASVAVYLGAQVSNDISVALGAHARIATAWTAALLTGAVLISVISDLILRSTLPLLIGAAVAAAVLIPGVRNRLAPQAARS